MGVYTKNPSATAIAESTTPPAIQNVAKRSSPTSTIVTPVTARSTYAGFANQSSSRLMPRSTNDCVGTGSRATRASQTPYVALNPTAMIARRTWRNLTITKSDTAKRSLGADPSVGVTLQVELERLDGEIWRRMEIVCRNTLEPEPQVHRAGDIHQRGRVQSHRRRSVGARAPQALLHERAPDPMATRFRR